MSVEGKKKNYIRFSSEDSILVDDEEMGPEMGPATPNSVASNKSEDSVLPGNRRRRIVLAMLVVGMALVVLFACTAARGFGPHSTGKGEQQRELGEKKAKLGKPDAHVADVAQSAMVSLSESKDAAKKEQQMLHHRSAAKEQSVVASDIPGAQFVDDKEEGKGQSRLHTTALRKTTSLRRPKSSGTKEGKAESVQESNMPGVHVAAPTTAAPAAQSTGTSGKAAQAATPKPWKEAAGLIVETLV